MSDLYNIVSNVVNAENLEEASNILYGKDGIKFNSKEHYQRIISDFMKKKENTIRKIGGNLVFDLNNRDDIWNIIFIGQYVLENELLHKKLQKAEKSLKELKTKLSKITSKHGGVIKGKGEYVRKAATAEHSRINDSYRTLNSVYVKLDNEIKILKEAYEIFENYDRVLFNNSNVLIDEVVNIDELKKAINIINLIRCSFGHDGIEEEAILNIDGTNLKVEIPIKYIEGFNKGRIIANDEDKIIVERTNAIAAPLLESLGYNIQDVQSFFYNVNPEYLSFLLEKVNYNFYELYKFKPHIFYYEKETKILLDNDWSIYKIGQLSSSDAFRNVLETRVLEVVLSKYYGIDITKLPDFAFWDAGITIELYEFLKPKGIDITKLPNIAFLLNRKVLRSRTKKKVVSAFILTRLNKG